jgi:hypothetical protein
MESFVSGGQAYLQAFDRTGAAYATMRLVGSPINLWVGGTQVAGFTASGMNLAAGAYAVSGTQVVGARQTGWPAPGGPGVYTVGAVYSQAEVTALRDAINGLQSTMQSLIGALRTHGLLGT